MSVHLYNIDYTVLMHACMCEFILCVGMASCVLFGTLRIHDESKTSQ